MSPTEELVAVMADKLSFDKMKANPATNNQDMAKRSDTTGDIKFMRKGIVSYLSIINIVDERINLRI